MNGLSLECFEAGGRRVLIAIIAHLRGALAPALTVAGALTLAAPASAADGYAPLQQVAPGVYVQRGADEAPSTANRGAVANLGVLVGASGVIVVNTGSSAEHGAALLAAVARLTDRPVVLAIDTQASPDQIMGNSTFTRRAIPVLAHRDTDIFMREHCDACVADVKAQAGTDALAQTRVAWPTRLIDGSQTIDAGGRTLQIVYLGWTKQPGCLAVLDRASGVLFTGDIASFGVTPQTQLGQLANWIDALGELQQLAPALVVPGHGAPGPAAHLERMREYLQALSQQTREAYLRGDGLLETTEHVDLAPFRGWALYEAHHRRNVHFAYLQIEEQDLKR
jgi:glyoxylase-like metal-dependent hydrolase (beta-lactamase superfamily II)